MTAWAISGADGVMGSASIVVRHRALASYNTPVTLFTATLTTSDHATGAGSGTLVAGDWLEFNLSGVTLHTWLTITLTVQ